MWIEVSREPSWLFLILGLIVGHALTSSGAIKDLLEIWKSLVNVILVPCYSLCTVAYIVSLLQGLVAKKAKPQPPSIQPLENTPEDVDSDVEGHVNMNGAFKLVKNENFEEFLEVQGVPWALRRAADKARPTHRFAHRGNTIFIHIQGIIESQTTYEINGPPKESNIRGRIFRDVLTYLETGDGIQTHKQAVTEDYDIIVTRRLAEDRKSLTMTSRAIFKDGRDSVETVQLFERIE